MGRVKIEDHVTLLFPTALFLFTYLKDMRVVSDKLLPNIKLIYV